MAPHNSQKPTPHQLASILEISGCTYPDTLLYDPEGGIWAREEKKGFRIGIAPTLSWISGGLTSVSFKAKGSKVIIDQSLGAVEGPKHFDVVRAPFDCVIIETNQRLLSQPRLANKDPFGEGWFALVEQSGGESRLLPLDQAAEKIRGVITRLMVRCFAEFPDMELFEIGTECSAVIVKLDELMKTARPGTAVHLVSDDPTSEIELARWEMTTGNTVVDSRAEASLHHFIIRKS